MSLRDDLDIAADIADILAYGQRAQMLENQARQLAALRDMQYQAQAQALRAEREKTLQDIVFSLRKSLPRIQISIQDNPRRALAELFHAERLMEHVPSEAFSGLEWKEYASSARSELDGVIEQLGVAHGDSLIVELSSMLSEARAKDEQARQVKLTAENFAKWEAISERERDKRVKMILSCVNCAGFLILILTCSIFFIADLNHLVIALVSEVGVIVSLNIYLAIKIPARPFPTNKK